MRHSAAMSSQVSLNKSFAFMSLDSTRRADFDEPGDAGSRTKLVRSRWGVLLSRNLFEFLGPADRPVSAADVGLDRIGHDPPSWPEDCRGPSGPRECAKVVG